MPALFESASNPTLTDANETLEEVNGRPVACPLILERMEYRFRLIYQLVSPS
jgi:hypothetical protein